MGDTVTDVQNQVLPHVESAVFQKHQAKLTTAHCGPCGRPQTSHVCGIQPHPVSLPAGESGPSSAQTHVLCKITSDPAVNVCFAGVGWGRGLATSLPPSSISVHTHWPVCSPAADVPRNPQPDTLGS